jgi:hypothetical protein
MIARVRRTTALPNETVSEDDYRRARNLDLDGLAEYELVAEIAQAAWLARRDPDGFVWRYPVYVTAQTWANERCRLCRERLVAVASLGAQRAGQAAKGKGQGWGL